jgi:NAD(P)-dependent dehydrogenase (short-subunit alcohol dehydrogenase family)
MTDLSEKHALVTGGVGTIGTALATALAAAGARVTVLDRPSAPPPVGHGWLGVDLGDLSGAQARVAAAGPFDILINNAAVIINKPFEEFSLEEYEDQIRINSSAAFALTRTCAPAMKAMGWGRVINLTSLTLNGQWEGFVPYVASKGAVAALTRAMAIDHVEDGIRINAVAPGTIESPYFTEILKAPGAATIGPDKTTHSGEAVTAKVSGTTKIAGLSGSKKPITPYKDSWADSTGRKDPLPQTVTHPTHQEEDRLMRARKKLPTCGCSPADAERANSEASANRN